MTKSLSDSTTLVEGEDAWKAAKALVAVVFTMLAKRKYVDIVFTDPDENKCVESRIRSVEEFLLIFNNDNVSSMVKKHGGITYLEPNMDTGVVRIGYIPRGFIAQASGATLQ